MSLGAVRRARKAMRPSSAPEDLAHLYLPFDSVLAAETGDADMQDALTGRRPMMHLVGASGSGKSSRINYALDTAEAPVQPIFASGTHVLETVTDSAAFLRNVCQAIARAAAEPSEMLRGTADQLGSDVTRSRGRKARLGGRAIGGELGRDVAETISGVQNRGPGEMLEGVSRALLMIAEQAAGIRATVGNRPLATELEAEESAGQLPPGYDVDIPAADIAELRDERSP